MIKVYIYRQFITKEIDIQNQQMAMSYKLIPHLQYLVHFFEKLSKFETSDPDEADYFFVPIFIAGWMFRNDDPGGVIKEHCNHLDRGNHLMISTADVPHRAEDLRFYAEMKLNPNRAYANEYKWMDERFNLIVLESTPTLYDGDIAFLPYQDQKLPYINRSRDYLITFAGALQHPWLPEGHIRNKLMTKFRDEFDGVGGVLIGTMQDAIKKADASDHYEIMARSIFTLCPAGMGRWTFRFVEALLMGSIPVILSDDYVLPFSGTIHWDDYVYVIPEKDLFKVPAILNALPVSEVYKKQAAIARDRHLFERDYSLGEVINLLASRVGGSVADIAVSKMRGPKEMNVICIDVTNKCDLACSNCTRLLENQDAFWEMSPDNFRKALQSLKNYQGIIAVIGGNPCMHTKFKELCEIFVDEVPNQEQRGLWTNNIFKHAQIIERTFGFFNLNPHDNQRAVPPLEGLVNKVSANQGRHFQVYRGASHHAPLLTAVKDLYPENEMWDRIVSCDINREWSASIVENKGELRAYFCEVAASFDLARGGDHGVPVTLDWWMMPIENFSEQIKKFCPGCGVPAKIEGHLDCEEIDTYTHSNSDIAVKSKKNKKRKIILLKNENIVKLGRKVTKYVEGC